jgi:hypothetical protein
MDPRNRAGDPFTDNETKLEFCWRAELFAVCEGFETSLTRGRIEAVN